MARHRKKPKETSSLSCMWQEIVGRQELIASFDLLWARGRTPPVVLLAGRQGVGKRLLAGRFLVSAYCQNSACGNCPDCLDIKRLDHEEVLWVETDEPNIKRKDIEQVSEHLSIQASGQSQGVRSVVIVDIEKLTDQAVNSLLKTLEEPAKGSHIVMTTNAKGRVLDTLLSRSVDIKVEPPTRVESINFLRGALEREFSEEVLSTSLRRSGGSPGLALTELLDYDAKMEIDRYISTCLIDIDGDWLEAAAELAKVYKLPVIELANRAEVILNQHYRSLLGVEQKSCLLEFSARGGIDIGVMEKQRKHLQQLRQLAGSQKIALNKQLAAEGLGLSRLAL